MPRYLLLGTRGPMSHALLDGLIAAGRPPLGVVVPGVASRGVQAVPAPLPSADGLAVLPAVAQESVIERAWRAGLPVTAVSGWNGESAQWLSEQRATFGVVACWPSRFPGAVCAAFDRGLWNLHPSHLPDYRGPMPFFWQRRDGLTEGAVTLHEVRAALDAGPIIAQRPLALPDGALEWELDALAGRAALRLVLEALEALERGTLRPTPQPSGGSYQSWPGDADFVVPTTWTARHAWNFMRVAQGWGVPFRVQGASAERVLRAPDGWSLHAAHDRPVAGEGILTIPFAEGACWWRAATV